MSIGTGIFLGSVILGLIYLFVNTKDRWKWKKILLWSLAVPIILVGLIATGLWAVDKYENRPTVQDSLLGIRLGMPESEVKYLKGEPKLLDGTRWVYETGAYSNIVLGIDFDNAKVSQVWVSSENLYLPYTPNISKYDNSAAIIEKLGKPTRVEMSKDNLQKMLMFDNYQTWVGLTQDTVNAVGVYDPKLVAPGFK